MSLSKNLQDTNKAFKGRSFSYVQDDSWVLQSPLEESDIPIEKDKIKKAIENYNFDKLFYSHAPKQNLALIISIFSQAFAGLSPWPISILDKIIFEGGELNQTDKEKLRETRNKQKVRIKNWERYSIIPDLGLGACRT